MESNPSQSPELYEATYGPYGPGDFYVEEHECISCGVPAAEAPDLIGWRPVSGCCYFFKQPETPGELERAISAVNNSCVCAVRYRGADPAILDRISEQSVDHASDSKTNYFNPITFSRKFWKRLRIRI